MLEETATSEQIRELKARLEEAEDTLRAVRSGEIDAFIVQGPDGEQVYALRSAEQPYRNLVEDMLEGASILTTEGDIAYCNRRFADLVEVPLEDAIGSAMERFVAPAERPAYRMLLATGSGKRRTQLVTATGRAIDVFLSLTTSVCDEVERRNLIITDLSELLDAQSGRNRAEQQSQAKDEFMAMLAHELRNPLSAITAAMQVITAAQGHHDVIARAHSIITRQTQHLAYLVDDLLDVGRVVTGKIVLSERHVDFGDLVRRAAAVFTERETQRQIALVVEPVWVKGDAVRLEQIVTNIVSNAVKYTPPGGRISITVCSDAGEAVLSVQDDGFGIAPELLPRVFDLFVQGERTLERAQGGLGIGLTLVRRLVALHRGTVTVASEGPGHGSLVTVRLPRTPAPHASRAGSSIADSGMAPRRVLIVEDNRDARDMFRIMLELSGHEVLEAEEGCLGLRMLDSERPDIAFIDVGLPGLDGYEIARRFRRDSRSDVLLVALTGYGTPEALERSRAAGFDHHLIKPVDPEVLNRLLATGGTRRSGAVASVTEQNSRSQDFRRPSSTAVSDSSLQ